MRDWDVAGTPSWEATLAAFRAFCDALDQRHRAAGFTIDDFTGPLAAAYAHDCYPLEAVVRAAVAWAWHEGVEYAQGDDGGVVLWIPGASPPRRISLADAVAAVRALVEAGKDSR